MSRICSGAVLWVAGLAAAPVYAAESEAPHTNLTRFNIDYVIPQGTGDVARVELWVTEDGGASWKRAGWDPDARTPVGFSAQRDGTYGFFIVAEDLAGNRSEEPSPGTLPQLTVVVDTRPPAVELVGPPAQAFGPSRPMQLEWRAVDEYLRAAPVSIEVSSDGGASWMPIRSGLPAEGSFAWKPEGPLPAGSKGFRFRVSAVDKAGNVGRATTGDVVFDAEPPTARALGPQESRTETVFVEYEASDVGDGRLESVALFSSPDEGKTWQEGPKDVDVESPLEWRAPGVGKWGLWVVATDRAGNVSKRPAAGDQPQAYVVVRSAGPKANLLTFNTGGFYRGGAVHPIVWEAKGEGLTDSSVQLEYSIDGGTTWHQIASDLPPTGRFPWRLPMADTDAALVRVSATTALGEKGVAVSEQPFTIDSTPPRAVARFDESSQAEPAQLPAEEPPPVERPPASVRASAPKKTQHPELSSARQHMAAGKFTEVEEVLRPLLARDPYSVEANVLLGESRAREADRLHRASGAKPSPEELLRRYEEAASPLRTAIRLDPSSNAAHVWLGVCLFQRGRIFYQELRRRAEAVFEWQAALEEYEKALRMPPDPPEEFYYAGITYYMLAVAGPERERNSRAERARELLMKALSGAPKAVAGGAHWYLAELAERRGDRTGALEHWNAALELLGEGGSRFVPEIRERIARLGGR